MFCRSCGKPLSDGAKFCRYCGAAQSRASSVSTVPPAGGAPLPPPAPGITPSAPPPAAPAPPTPPMPPAPPAPPAPNSRGRKNKESSTFSKVLSVLVVGAIACFCIFADTKPDAKPAAASPSHSLSPFANITPPSSVSLPQTPTPTLYVDKRIPDYRQTDPEWQTFRYEWYCQDGSNIIWLEVPIDLKMYTYYRSLDRYMKVGEYYHYAMDANNREIIRQIVSGIQDVGSTLSYDDMDMIREVVKFVQDVIEYEYDIDSTGQAEYPRYPIETLCERRGDCEDTAILMAAMLKELGYEVCFVDLPQHVAVAVQAVDDYDSTPYYELNGHRYVYIESTGSGWNIGDVPEEYLQVEAEFFLVD